MPERSKSVGAMPPAAPDTGAARPRSHSAPPSVSGPQEFKKDVGAYQAWEKDALNATATATTDRINLGGGVGARGEATAGIKVGGEAKIGISNQGLVAAAGAGAQAQAALKGRVEGRIVGMDVTGDGKLEVAANAAVKIGATITTSGLKAEAGASANTNAVANAGGTLQVSGNQQVNGAAEAEVYAEAKAKAEGKVGLDGVGGELNASAGAGAKVGVDLGGKEGDNSIKYSPRVVFGKIGAGVKGGVTHKDGKIGIAGNYTANIGVGVEVNFKAEYSTDQVAAAGRNALAQLRQRNAVIDATTGHSFAEKTDGVVRTMNSHFTIATDYGDHLAQEGEKQGGVVGAAHVGAGTVIKYGGKAVEVVGGAFTETGGAVVKATSKLYSFAKSWL